MKNKIYIFLFVFFFIITILGDNVRAQEQFNFNVSEIEILQKGNLFKGLKKGEISTNDGIIIEADRFEYDKIKNILKANGNVQVKDTIKNYIIFSERIIYYKNDEIIITEGNSKATDSLGQTIIADNFKYNKIKNILNANGNVKLKNDLKDVEIFSDFVTQFRNEKKIITKGKTSSIIHSKYNITTSDIIYLEDLEVLSSNFKTIITDDKSNLYNLDKFKYSITREELKGENIVVISNFNLPKSDKYFFSNAMINLKTSKMLGKDTRVEMHKSIFGNKKNDPRLIGVSSQVNENITTINKGVFTSCAKKDSCPPWSISADKITHDKEKKILKYKNALLKLYNLPVFYLPKFFHPDPSVERQSGFLQPSINDSDILGSSINSPYFHVISDSKDLTLNPVIFDSGGNDKLRMLQTEFRQENKNSSFITDFGITNNFKSKSANKSKNLTHFFSNYDLELQWDDFKESNLNISIEKVSKDNYLKIFENYMFDNSVRPKNYDVLTSQIKIDLVDDNYSFSSGLSSYESVNKRNNDRYQHILPYYNFSSTLFSNDIGRLSLYSSGNNILQDTNNLRSRVTNDLNFNSDSFINNRFGFKNNFNIYFKNVNTVAKKDTVYKSSPQSELMNILEFNTSLPFIKDQNNRTELIKPDLSFRFNPGDMKNHSTADRKIDAKNIFLIDRLGIGDSLETGKSLTAGIEYRNMNNLNENEYGVKFASVFRDKEEETIPTKSTINKKNSYLFGSVDYKNSDIFNLEYNFAIDDNFEKNNNHRLNFEFQINNFVTTFNFIEEGDELGTAHIVENNFKYQFDEKNFLSFKTRRNKEINLTEYYDIIYEYKNDCLVAGLKFNKSYYEDNDLKPTENLMFTISIIPVLTMNKKLIKIFMKRIF